MIEVYNVDYSYDNKTNVLKDICLTVASKEVVAIMGASGSGKTTLMDIISGLKKPLRGTVNVCGKNIHDMKEDELEKFKLNNVGYIFQHYNLIPFLSSFENIMLPSTILNTKNSELADFAMKLIDRLNINSKEEKKPDELSGGEKQRVAIARALIMSPKVVLADEPTGALDSENTKIFMEYFIKLIKQLNSSALIVTHDEHVAQYCDRIIRLG